MNELAQIKITLKLKTINPKSRIDLNIIFHITNMKQTLETLLTEKMKKYKNFCKYLIIKGLMIISMCFPLSFSLAQEIDNARMEQDIDVAEKILEELFNPNQNHTFGSRYKSRGLHLKDYGVIFQVPSVAMTIPYTISGQGISYSITGDAIILDRLRATHADDDDHDDENKNYKNKNKSKIYRVRDLDSILMARRMKIIDKMKSFYLNYGDLIGQLKDNDKIMLVYDSPDREYTATIAGNWGQFIKSIREKDENEDDNDDNDDEPKVSAPRAKTENRRTDKIVMEIARGDINQYKSGKLNKEQFLSKIKIQEIEKNTDNEMEFDILAGIFEKIVKRESNDFYFRDRVHYQRLANFGVMYDLELQPEHNWFIEGRYNFEFNNRIFELKDRAFMLDEKRKNKDKHEKELKKEKENMEREKAELEKDNKEKKIEMEKFEKQIKENLIQYGRTLRSLKPDEFLALNIKFKSWSDENTPQNMLFTIKKSVLEAYDKREISLEDAISKIEVKK